MKTFNLPLVDPYFVGRRAQLDQLASFLGQGAGIITAIHGLGGLGKTALAHRYAQVNKGRYQAGIYVLPCEGAARLDQAIAPLVPEFGIDSALPGDAQVRAVAAALESRAADSGSRALLILDNVTQAALLGNSALEPLLSRPAIHLLATTRLSGDELGAGDRRRRVLPLEELPEEDCVELIRRRQPGEVLSPDEEDAARRIARHLGGFTLAVEATAIYLGRPEAVSCSAFLEWLQRDTLAAADEAARDPGSQMNMAHREKLLGATLAPTIEGHAATPGLPPAELHVLRLASLLPPDHILADWLRALAAQAYPELGETAGGAGTGSLTPWDRALRRLTGLQLLTPLQAPRPSHVSSPLSAFCFSPTLRIHRMVSNWVRSRWPATERDAAGEELLRFVTDRAFWLQDEFDRNPSQGWLQQPLALTAEHLALRIDPATGEPALRTPLRREWGVVLDVAAGIALRVTSLERAIELVEWALQIAQALYDANPGDSQAARDLSVSLNKLGDFFLRRGDAGDPQRALEHYQRCHQTLQALYDANPGDSQAARDFWVSCWKMAQIAEQTGLGDAQAWWRQAFTVLHGLKQSGCFLSPEDEGHLQTLRSKVESF